MEARSASAIRLWTAACPSAQSTSAGSNSFASERAWFHLDPHLRRPGRGGLGQPHVGALTEGEELRITGVLRLRSPLQCPCWGWGEVLLDQLGAARGGAPVPGDLDRPGRTDVDDDYLLLDTAAVHPDPHRLTDQGVRDRVLSTLEGDHRHRGRHRPGETERDGVDGQAPDVTGPVPRPTS